MLLKKAIMGLVVFGSVGVASPAFAEMFRETPPCPTFSKQVPMTHTWEDDSGQWSCTYLLTIIGTGLRDPKGGCDVKMVETKRACVGAQADRAPRPPAKQSATESV